MKIQVVDDKLAKLSLKINGRMFWFDHLENFQLTEYPYEWQVERANVTYRIFGGKKAGGRKNEWYVLCHAWREPIATTSLVDSLQLLDRM